MLVATGGVSYPTTGSTGDGYKLARQAGHTLVEPVPSLVSLVSHDPDCKKMMGLALKNVTLTLFEDGKAIFDEQGEMLFTHFGISGPLTLSASSHLGDMKKHKYHAEIDLKPALSEEQLYDRITRDFALLANHAAQGALVKLLPSSMQPVMVARWGIDPATKANQITREQKRELVQLIKHWRVSIDARGDLAHAVITSGGVSVREVDPKTMQSKKALGLYFAGEVLDVDAYTGGYNLQIAFCTNNGSLFPPLAAVAVVAGHSIARPIALRATGSHPGGRSSEKLPACCPGQQCSSPLRPPPVKMCLERSAERDKHKNIKIIFR